MVLTAASCSPRRSGFLVTVACACYRRRDAGIEASGPHDFAVRELALFVNSAAASTASPANVRDDRETPLCVGRDGVISEVICFRTKQEYFCKWGWTDFY
jgi:hypothetical protein